MKENLRPGKPKPQQLHGWDDEKVYFWTEGKGDICVSDIPELMDRLENVCRDFIENEWKREDTGGTHSVNE